MSFRCRRFLFSFLMIIFCCITNGVTQTANKQSSRAVELVLEAQEEAEVEEEGETAASDEYFPAGTGIDSGNMPPAETNIELHKHEEQDAVRDIKAADDHTFIFHRFIGGVSAIADSAVTHSFFVAGNDGFITRFLYESMESETWQVSVIPIKHIAVHPKKPFIAVYATDGFRAHSVSLWDWKTKKQLYTKSLTSTALCLSWSAQGTYLFIGTASPEGITVLDVKGTVKKVYPKPPGIVMLAATGTRERSIVTYGQTGRLVYLDLKKKAILAQYKTESSLDDPQLIAQYTQIVGYKNGYITVIKADSGAVIKRYPARSALFAGTIADSLPVWIEQGETAHMWYLCHGDITSAAFTLPIPARITAARHVDDAVVIGTDDGRLYRITQQDDKNLAVHELNADRVIRIRDICIKDSQVYMLSDSALYVSASPADMPTALITSLSAERCIPYGSGFLLWSLEKQAPLYYAEEGQEPSILYRPQGPLASVSVYGNSITIVEPFSGLTILGGINGRQLFTYKAAGLQDAVQIDDTFVLVSKSSSSGKPLLLINYKTGETIPLSMEGAFAYSVQRHNETDTLFSCIRLKTDNAIQTDVMLLHLDTAYPSRSSFITALSYRGEDINAVLCNNGDAVLTTLGEQVLTYYDTKKKWSRKLPRSYALPRKALMTDTYILSVNYDGSLSWWSRSDLKLLPHTPCIRPQ